jgi:hemerythrin
MLMLNWHKKYETGVRLIDEQHQSLFKAINDLHEAMIGGQGKTKIRETLGFLVRYTATHFKEEEGIMVANKYPGVDKHKVEHEKLLKTAHELEVKMSDQEYTLPMEVSAFLRDWITHHINESDLGFIKYLQTQTGAGKA